MLRAGHLPGEVTPPSWLRNAFTWMSILPMVLVQAVLRGLSSKIGCSIPSFAEESSSCAIGCTHLVTSQFLNWAAAMRLRGIPNLMGAYLRGKPVLDLQTGSCRVELSTSMRLDETFSSREWSSLVATLPDELSCKTFSVSKLLKVCSLAPSGISASSTTMHASIKVAVVLRLISASSAPLTRLERGFPDQSRGKWWAGQSRCHQFWNLVVWGFSV